MASSCHQFEGIFYHFIFSITSQNQPQYTHKADHRNGKHIRELGLDVVDDVAASGGAGHDGGIGDRGCMITEDTAAEHSTSYQRNVVAHGVCHWKGDYCHDGHGSHGSSGCEGDHHCNQESQRREVMPGLRTAGKCRTGMYQYSRAFYYLPNG